MMPTLALLTVSSGGGGGALVYLPTGLSSPIDTMSDRSGGTP